MVEEAADPWLAIVELGEHLARARAALKLPHGLEELAETDAAEEKGHRITRVLDVAQAAVGSLTRFAGGLQRRFASGGEIALHRDRGQVTVCVLGAPTAADIAAFIDELADIDRRLLDAAELLGLLIHLGVGWGSAGFAPLLLLKTLVDSGPRILELGAALAVDQAEYNHR